MYEIKRAQQINCYVNYYLAFQYLSFTVDSRFGWNEHRRQRPVQESVRLTFDIRFFDAVTQLFQIQLCLDVDMLSALDCLGCLYSHLLLLLCSALCSSTTSCFLLALKLHRIWSRALLLINTSLRGNQATLYQVLRKEVFKNLEGEYKHEVTTYTSEVTLQKDSTVTVTCILYYHRCC